jgi:hypothetical protein
MHEKRGCPGGLAAEHAAAAQPGSLVTGNLSFVRPAASGVKPEARGGGGSFVAQATARMVLDLRLSGVMSVHTSFT